MSGTRGSHFSTNECSHCNVVDNWEDESVCTDCGLVLLTQAYSTANWTSAKPYTSSNSIHEYIKDVGENACIAESVIIHATNYYDQIRSTLVKTFQDKHIAAYALYESLNKFEVPRLVEEIEYYSGVKLQKLWEIETSLILETPLNDPKHYVHRYCTMLNFSYADQMFVRDVVERIQTDLPLGNLRCNCLVAVIIYLHCKETKKKITLRKICEICSISATSVHRVIRQLNELRCQIVKTPNLFWMVKHIGKNV